jgi:hypothetical protein
MKVDNSFGIESRMVLLVFKTSGKTLISAHSFFSGYRVIIPGGKAVGA